MPRSKAMPTEEGIYYCPRCASCRCIFDFTKIAFVCKNCNTVFTLPDVKLRLQNALTEEHNKLIEELNV